MLGQLAPPREQGSGTPPPPATPRPAQPVNSESAGVSRPGRGSADPQKFAAGVPGGARRSGRTRDFPLETSEGDG